MKKNKWMRLASVLLVLCLLTTSVISGTFAKYVTKDSASDQARVAKWGIVLDVEGTLFDDAYLNQASGNTPAGDATANITVQSANGTDLVVAPGTKNADGMTFSIKGTAEVSTAVEIKLQQTETNTAAPKDIFLMNGLYRDWTDAAPVAGNDYGKAFEIAETGGYYYPVVFTLEETAASGAYNIKATAEGLTGTSDRFSVNEDSGKVIVTGNWADMQKLFAALTTAMSNLAPGYVFDNTFKLTWEWAFEQVPTDAAANAPYDAADTLLGNLQAGTGALADGSTVTFASESKASALTDPTFSALTDGTDYNLNTGFYFEISVTQVD